MAADLLALSLWRGADGVTCGGSPSSRAVIPAFFPGRRARPPGGAHRARVEDGCAPHVAAFLACYFSSAEAVFVTLGHTLAGTTLRGAAHALIPITFLALTALPTDAMLRAFANTSAGSAGASIIATLRRCAAAHPSGWRPRSVLNRQCVPAAEAACLVASGMRMLMRMPLGAAVSLAEAVASRATLVIEHGGCAAALLHLCPDAAAFLRVGGLLMRDGHASAVLLGPAAQVRRCDGRPNSRALAARSQLGSPALFFCLPP